MRDRRHLSGTEAAVIALGIGLLLSALLLSG
jgi:hypothetical protein